MTNTKQSADQLITQVIKSIEDAKGIDISLLDLREIDNTVCDYFIICSGTSNTHVDAIAGKLSKDVSKVLKEKPWHTEGEQTAEWVLLDYVNVVVHVFQKPVREHYDLEGLWGDAKITNFTDNN
jgi:ribosome-associated protein